VTTIQEAQQAEGPHRPTVRQLQHILADIPGHLEVRAISINGQACVTIVETYHEGLMQSHEFNTHEYYAIKP
jgi:hypothetical protein